MFTEKEIAMKKLLIALVTTLALVVPITGSAGQDETQRKIYQQAQEAQQKLNAAKAASADQRSKLMQEHMKLMQAAMKQMQSAKPGANLSAQQMSEWIDEHMKLMDQMMGQMMDEHHMMMGGPGMMGGPSK
jgi:flagellar biosynthesis GTPase FlhF